MKKIYLGIIAVVGLFVLTACGGSKNKVTCTADLEENGQKAAVLSIIADLDKDDKVEKVSAEIAFDDKDKASQAYSMYQLVIGMVEQLGNEQDKANIKDLKIELDGKKIVINDYAAFAKMQMSSEGDPETGEQLPERESLIGMTKEKFKTAIESDKEQGVTFSCK